MLPIPNIDPGPPPYDNIFVWTFEVTSANNVIFPPLVVCSLLKVTAFCKRTNLFSSSAVFDMFCWFTVPK